MKKLFLLLAFFSLSISFAQAPEGMVLVKNFEKAEEKQPIQINHQIIADALDEFVDAADYYKVYFEPYFETLKAIEFVKADSNFKYKVEKDRILINSDYERYPNLARLITLQAIGVYLDMPLIKKEKRLIMSADWQKDARHEFYAENLRMRPVQKKQFFESLAKKHPLTYKF